MPRSRSFVLAALGCVPLLASTVSAQWVPNGTQLFEAVFGEHALAASDGRSGAVVLGLGTPDLVTRVTDAGLIPAGWPSSAVPPFTIQASGLAGDEAGGAYVGLFRQGPDNNEVVVHHVLSDGTSDPSWPAGGRVVDAPAGATFQGCRLVGDGGGGVYAVWFTYVLSDSQDEIRAIRLKKDSAVAPGWPTGGRLLGLGRRLVELDPPQSSPAGLLLTGSYVTPPYPGIAEEPFIARLAPDGSTPAGWPDSIGPVPFTLTGYVPQYTPDANGGVYYTWSNSVLGRLVHLRSDATLDPAWPDSGLTLLSKSISNQFFASLRGDGAGGCFAVLAYDSAGSAATPVGLVPHLVRIDESGQVVSGWPALGVRLPFDKAAYYTNNLHNLELVLDDAGGVYSLWFGDLDMSSNTFGSVGAHHTSANGQTPPSWPSGGVLIARAPGTGEGLEGVANGHGGLIAVWEDLRNDPYPGVFALGVGPDGQLTTDVRDHAAAPFSVLTISPHPARGTLRLAFSLASASNVTLEVMDIAGRRVRRLEDGLLAPGQHAIPWDGTDDDGRILPPGVYLARAEMGGVVRTARIVRLD